MEANTIPSTVEDILKWKVNKGMYTLSVEEHNSAYTLDCGGSEVTDVLFSFLGIYAIGIWVFNKNLVDVFKIEKNKIRVNVGNDKKDNQILCSKKFLLQLQEEKIADIEVSELNDCIKEFAEEYFSVGNLIPMWPGGNKVKGNQNKGFMDIPEVFFCRYYEWYQILAKRENAYLKEMTKYINDNKKRFVSLEDFLKWLDTKEKYKEYIKHVVNVIKSRTEMINAKR